MASKNEIGSISSVQSVSYEPVTKYRNHNIEEFFRLKDDGVFMSEY